jgi:hypothetical protein
MSFIIMGRRKVLLFIVVWVLVEGGNDPELSLQDLPINRTTQIACKSRE